MKDSRERRPVACRPPLKEESLAQKAADERVRRELMTKLETKAQEILVKLVPVI